MRYKRRRQRKSRFRAEQAGLPQAPRSSSPATISAAARRASTRPGRCWISASAASSRRASPIFSTTTASRTASCRSRCRRPISTSSWTTPSGRQCHADRRSRGAGNPRARRRRGEIRHRSLSQTLPAQRPGRHRPDPAKGRGDHRFRGAHQRRAALGIIWKQSRTSLPPSNWRRAAGVVATGTKRP